MRHLVFTATLCLAGVTAGGAQALRELVGTLEPRAVPGDMGTSVALSPAADDARARLGSVAAAGEKVWVGDLSFGNGKQPIYVLQAADGVVSVATDLDRNGTIDAKERIAMTADTSSVPKSPPGPPMLAATLRIATPGSAFPDFPVSVGLSSASLNPTTGGEGGAPPRVYLRTSYQAFAAGSVVLDGKPTKVRLIVNAKDFTVNPSKSYQYVDCDGDGELDTDWTSLEMGYGRGVPVVFHVGTGERYVSIKGIDVANATITLVARTASDYERIELRVGAVLPDFSFKTLDGSTRRLSDFRGKYLVIDFWGTWCGPCVGEIPFLKKAYETYKDKGLEILGMDFEQPDVTPEDFAKGLEGVKKFVAEKGVTWTQAQTESIKPLYENRFQIVAWPTIILVDPTGAIVSVDRTHKGEPGLRGDQLDKTLAAIFSKEAVRVAKAGITPGGLDPVAGDRPMSAEDIVRRYIEAVWNQGEAQALIELTAPDFAYRLGGLPPFDRSAMAEFVRATRVAFPDWRVNIDDVVANGDRVAVRWSGVVTHEGPFHGVPRTGRRIAVSGINIYAVEAGKVKAEWEETDGLGILRQLGILPDR